MESVFLRLLNISITASWLVLAILLLRIPLKKAPKWICGVLWGFVGLRLILPFSFESTLSLIPSKETFPETILSTDTPAINSGISAINATVNPIIADSLSPTLGDSVNPIQVISFAASVLWVIGMIAMLLYMLISYLRVRHRVREAVLQDGIWFCDHIESAFILGVFRPRIYMPSDISREDFPFALAHEKAHLKRFDHIWKPLGFLLLTVYWFNPLLWVAYILLCRDIEYACDEKVMKKLGTEHKVSYSHALINAGISRKTITACPLAFGEVGVKERVKNVLNYKKPAFWVIVIALILCLAVAVCFLLDPINKMEMDWTYDGTQVVSISYPYTFGIYFDLDQESYSEIRLSCTNGRLQSYANSNTSELTIDAGDSVEWWVGDNYLHDFPDKAMISFRVMNENTLVGTGELHFEKTKTVTGAQGYGEKVTYHVTFESDTFEFASYQKDPYDAIICANGKASPTLEKLKKQYPQYFDLNTENGLTVYAWMLEKDEYEFAIRATGDGFDPTTDYGTLVGASTSDILTILSVYDLPAEYITVAPFDHPAYGYTDTIDDEIIATIHRILGLTQNIGLKWTLQPQSSIDRENYFSFFVSPVDYDTMSVGSDEGTLKFQRASYSPGEEIMWSPYDENGQLVKGTTIFFSVHFKDEDGADSQYTYGYINIKQSELDPYTYYATMSAVGDYALVEQDGAAHSKYVLLLQDSNRISYDTVHEKYPEYCHLDASNGLDIYVWQMTKNSYSFGLRETGKEAEFLDLMSMKGAGAEEMKIIVESYGLDREDIHIIPWQNPISSYIGEYWLVGSETDIETVRKEYLNRVEYILGLS